MNTYRIVWTAPHKPDQRVLFIEAQDRDSAVLLFIDHVERKLGVARPRLLSCDVYEAPSNKLGRVL